MTASGDSVVVGLADAVTVAEGDGAAVPPPHAERRIPPREIAARSRLNPHLPSEGRMTSDGE
jgi:hypothetical protein